MRTIDVQYHREAEGWWAESADVPGFVATGATITEVRGLVREGLPFYLELDETELEVSESVEGSLLIDVRFAGTEWSRTSGSSQPGRNVRVHTTPWPLTHRPAPSVLASA